MYTGVGKRDLLKKSSRESIVNLEVVIGTYLQQ